MSTSSYQQLPSRGSQIFALLMKSWKLIAIPVLLCTLAAGWYAMKPKTYLASQSLVVRDDMIGESFKPGRFESLDSMKTAQETILHIAREPSVVRKALESIGPPQGKGESWLQGDAGVEAVEAAQEAISIVAPNGAEFGKTEVIVLQVKAKSQERAGQLVTALLDETESNLRKLRTQRLASMESELSQSLALAEEDYKSFANDLQDLEREIGPDLPTLLNMINDVNAGNDFQVALENIRTAARTAQAQLDVTTKQLESLRATSMNPEELVATSNELLEAQPALSRLKDGLIDLQLKLSDDLGKFEEAHPKISKARFAISQTKRQIHEELQVAIRGLESQHSVRSQQIDRLNEEEKDFQQRLAVLTNNRVRYATLASQAKKRNEEHAKARAEYAEIKSLGKAAQSVDLMTRLEAPFISGKAVGPGRTKIVGSGLLGGVMIGLGLVMFFSAPGSLPIIEPPPTGPGENMVRPNDNPRPPAPTSNRPNASDQPRSSATRPVQVVKQLGNNPVAPAPSSASTPNQPSQAQAQPVATSETATDGLERVAESKVQEIKFATSVDIHSDDSENSPSLSPSIPLAQPWSPSNMPASTEDPKDSSLELPSEEPPAPLAPKPVKFESGFSSLDEKTSSELLLPPVEIASLDNVPPKTAKVAPQRAKPVPESRKVPTISLPEKTIELPANNDFSSLDSPVIGVNELRKELGAEPLPEPEEESRNTSSPKLDEVKQRLMDAALQSLEGRKEELEAENGDSLQDRIKRLTDPGQDVQKTIVLGNEDNV